MSWIGRAVAAALLCTAAACQDLRTPMGVPEDDADMNRSIARARAEVATFIERLERPAAGDRLFALRAPVRDGVHVEHFWLDGVRYRDGSFEGSIANDQEFVRTVKFGDRLRVARDEISDWMFVENNRLVGGYTLRVMLDRLDAEERKAMLASFDFTIE